ncbi:RDD family protein [Sporosarcina aquimarina]|uniref:RDD family protein n=1 Tax=Sporosarcina aquimarina TaxID=114975 RepID=UPI00295E683E|nr:RDD family protein [Sporosarcina aquimarina]
MNELIQENHAGLGIRVLASFLDFLVLSIIVASFTFIIKGSFSLSFANGVAWQSIYTLYLMVVPIVWSGYIIGKRLCNIQVKRMDHGNVTLSNMFMREIVGYYLIGSLTLGISIVVSAGMILFREDKRSIHDLVGGTYVARN